MKLKSYLPICIAVQVAVMALTVNAATNDIVPGRPFCEFVSGAEQDVYLFQAASNEFVMVVMSPSDGSNFDPFFDVRDANGMVVGQPPAGPVPFLQALGLTNSGTFQIVCRDADGVGAGNYCVTLIKNPGPNAAEDGETNSIAAGQTREGGAIGPGGDLDAYHYAGTAGKRITIQMASGRSSQLTPRLDLWAPDGTILTGAQGTDTAFLESYQLPMPGAYILVCRDLGGTRSGGYRLSLIENPGPNEAEEGETNTIAAGQIRGGTILPDGDLDAYQYMGTAGKRITVQMASQVFSSITPRFDLWGPDGTILVGTNGDDTAFLESYQLPLSGPYIIVCRDLNASGVDGYGLSLVENPGPNEAEEGETNTIAAGQTRPGSIWPPGDLDAYHYEGTAGKRITIQLAAGQFSQLTPRFDLWAPDGTILTGAHGTDTAFLESYQLPMSGAYIIVCRDLGGTRGSEYRLSLIENPGPNEAEEGEFNTIAAGQTRPGSIFPIGDLDAYHYAGTAGKRITIQMASQVFSSITPRFELWGPDGTILIGTNGNDTAFLESYQLPLSGNYIIACRDLNGLGADGYGLSLIENPGPNEAEEGETNTIAAGQTRPGSIWPPGDLDVFAVEAAIGDIISLQIAETSNFGFDPQVDLWAPDGTVIAAAGGARVASLSFLCLLQGGTYLVVCRDADGSGGGDYSVSLTEHLGPPPPTAPPEYLQIGTCSNEVYVRWSTNAVGFRLQCTERLAAPPSAILWSNIPPPYGGFAGYYFVTNAIPPDVKFFRLIKP